MRRLFGTDGVRGVANSYPMTTEIAMQVGRAIAFIVKDKLARPRHRHRQGHPAFRLYAGKRAGRRHLLDGRRRDAGRPAADPGHRLYHHLDARRRRRGHLRLAQPFQDNGIKIFAHDGFKLPDKMEGRSKT
jgi:phosphoglucosamine mutase